MSNSFNHCINRLKVRFNWLLYGNYWRVNMITIRVKIISYDKDVNTCKAQLLNGDIIELDPYVCCAITLSDDDYHAGKGADIVGKSFLLTKYTVYADNVVPHEGGMIAV